MLDPVAHPVGDGDPDAVLQYIERCRTALAGNPSPPPTVVVVTDHTREFEFLCARAIPVGRPAFRLHLASSDPFLLLAEAAGGLDSPIGLSGTTPGTVVILGGLHWLPPGDQGIALGIFQAICAARHLPLLAQCERWNRSIAYRADHVIECATLGSSGPVAPTALILLSNHLRLSADVGAERDPPSAAEIESAAERLAQAQYPRGLPELEAAVERVCALLSESPAASLEDAVTLVAPPETPALRWKRRSDIASLVQEAERLRERLDDQCLALLGSRLFAAVRLPPGPQLTRESPQWFAALVARWYAVVIDAGHVRVGFLSRLRIHPEDRLVVVPEDDEFVELLEALRTWLAHGVAAEGERARLQQRSRDRWFVVVCGTTAPESYHWRELTFALLRAACDFLDRCADRLHRLERSSELLDRFRLISDRAIPMHVWKRQVAESLNALGCPLDVDKLVRRFAGAWQKKIEALASFSLKPEILAPVVEPELLLAAADWCPVGAQDVMKEFGVPPGPRVGELAALARSEYRKNPRLTRQELLVTLREALPRDGDNSGAIVAALTRFIGVVRRVSIQVRRWFTR